jgi:hypothetical protein
LIFTFTESTSVVCIMGRILHTNANNTSPV